MAGLTGRTVHALVRGRVQGVGFRWFVRQRARALELAGWVRNKPDGTVEFVASGSARAVETLLTIVRTGPPHAVVHELQISDADEGEPGVRTFDIRR